jgi:hypothetical protein
MPVFAHLMRKPDLIIGPRDNPQTIRWHWLKAFGFQFALHKWLRSDSDRTPHDHKADNVSIILSPQGYWELVREWYDTPRGGDPYCTVSRRWYYDRWHFRKPWRIYFRKAETLHRVKLCDTRSVWTIWIRWPERREWGYWCDGKGWVHNRDYNKQTDYYREGVSEVGQGCD